MTSADWRHRAACLSIDPELFFPISLTGPGAAQVDQAREVCARCPVRVDCLAWAVEHSMGYGVWGGLDEDQRKPLGRRSGRSGTPRLIVRTSTRR